MCAAAKTNMQVCGDRDGSELCVFIAWPSELFRVRCWPSRSPGTCPFRSLRRRRVGRTRGASMRGHMGAVPRAVPNLRMSHRGSGRWSHGWFGGSPMWPVWRLDNEMGTRPPLHGRGPDCRDPPETYGRPLLTLSCPAVSNRPSRQRPSIGRNPCAKYSGSCARNYESNSRQTRLSLPPPLPLPPFPPH